jgi:lipopolysaccharide/colanic/teichoic acid biosynthesis glycosyltransferase
MSSHVRLLSQLTGLADDTYELHLKRPFDICISVLALAVFLPVLGLLAILVRCDGGPALFKHERVGKDGRLFNCLKFRSMTVNSNAVLNQLFENDAGARRQWEQTRKLKSDPRITKIGRFLRKLSADELPQFINVLLGDMSLVGPRPVTLAELFKYGQNKVFYEKLRPGITGLWQISGRNDVSYEDRINLDVKYCDNISFLLDSRIIFRTTIVVLTCHGAY